jgi:uncharacterized protein YkwD
MKISLIRFLFLALLLVKHFQLTAQQPQQQINFENPNIEFLEKLVFQLINEHRDSLGLPTLNNDITLKEAAKDQAKYNYKTGDIGSVQQHKKTATPALRVNKHGGFHLEITELNNAIVMGEKTRVKGIRGRVVLNSYQQAAIAICSEWLNSRTYSSLVKNDELYSIGIGTVFVPDEKVIFATAVMASEPYHKIEGLPYSKNAYKVKPYSRDACKTYEREFGYLPELFSSSLKIEDNKIYFQFHDLSVLTSLLKSSRDGMAVDIIMRNQFDCLSGNKEHPSPIESGFMLKPVRKGKLMRKNILKETNQFLAYLGDLPTALADEDIELNLLILQDKCHCASIFHNNIDGKNVRLLDIDFAIDTISITEDIDSLSRQINFTIPFEKNKSTYQVEDIKPILDSIQLNRYDIKQINITAFSSIEGNAESNEILQQKRAESILAAIQQYQLQKVNTSITTQENWDGFFESIKNSPYNPQFQGLDKESVRSKVNSDTLGYDLEPYLEGQRKATINVGVESIYIDSLSPTLLPEKFKKAIFNNEYVKAKGIQSIMLKYVEEGTLDKEVLFPDYQIPYLIENMPLMNNILAARLKYAPEKDMNAMFESLKEDMVRFTGIAPDNPYLNFNKQLIELYYWSQNINYLMVDEEANIDQPKELYKSIRKLYNSKIDNWKVNQLLLNYHLIAADFYYETKDHAARERSLKQVKKLVQRSKLDQEQTHVMAGYFMFQIHMDWAIEIMTPFIAAGDYSEDFLFRFLSIAIYDERKVSEEEFIRYLRLGRNMNEERYCALFGKPNMSFQLLRNKTIKQDYCTTCNH